MPIIKLETIVDAPVERVFDLARSIDLHAATMTKYKERVVGGVTSGLISLNETVTWEATHFGVKQKLTSKITAYQRPRHFRDSMVQGTFRRFDHDHFFEERDGRTVIKDVFDYESPFGIFGKIADRLFVESHLRQMLEERNQIIKRIAEGDDWQKFLRADASA